MKRTRGGSGICECASTENSCARNTLRDYFALVIVLTPWGRLSCRRVCAVIQLHKDALLCAFSWEFPYSYISSMSLRAKFTNEQDYAALASAILTNAPASFVLCHFAQYLLRQFWKACIRPEMLLFYLQTIDILYIGESWQACLKQKDFYASVHF